MEPEEEHIVDEGEEPAEGQGENSGEAVPKKHKGASVVRAHEASYAFKVLCTDELTKALLGTRGQRKDDIQAATGARLVFSNKGDYFPNSHYRVLVIYAEDPSSIVRALEEVLPKLIECGDMERSNPSPHGLDMIGKESGEYIFRLAISKKTSSGLIGSGGANIKQVRAEAGIKLFIDNETIFGHQMVRVIGQPDAILKGLGSVNEYVQTDAGSEEYHHWAQLVNFSEATNEGIPHEQHWEPAGDWRGEEPPAKRHRAASVIKREVASHALKVLCTDELTKCILGPRGARKDDIQAKTGARLVFSNKGDYFPNSHFRVLVIYADDPSFIFRVIQEVLPFLIECGNQERSHPPPHGPDLVGKEVGEYIFRIAIAKKTSSALIGSGGVNIKQLRAEAGIKVFIDNETVFGHQMTRVIGQPEALLKGLEKVNEYVQMDAGSEAYYQWAQLVNFSEATEEDANYERWEAPADTPREHRGSPAGRSSHYPQDEGVGRLAEVVHSMPRDTANISYAINCKIMDERLPYILGEGEEFLSELKQTTNVDITIDEHTVEIPDVGHVRNISFIGPLSNIYAAHLLLIKRDQSLDEQDPEQDEKQAKMEELQAQMAELQAKLNQISDTGGGKSKGEKSGKGKSKGKSKKGKS